MEASTADLPTRRLAGDPSFGVEGGAEALKAGLLAWTPAALVVTAGLGLSAAMALAYHLLIGFRQEDTNFLETALVLATGRQLTEGPGALYGPYGGDRISPLIHAPLFYRIAGLAAWPLWASGVDPLEASLIAGRILAAISTLALLFLVDRLGRRPGAPPISGVWSALLVASSVTLLNFPVSVRADLMALAFQTGGFLCAVRALDAADRPWRRMIGMGLAFAAAACLKQHDIGVAVAAYVGLLLAWSQGRFRLVPILASGFLALGVTLAYYGIENVVTRGGLFESAFRVPSQIREVLPGGWVQVKAAWHSAIRESAPILALIPIAWLVAPRRGVGGLGFFEAWLAFALAIEIALTTFCFFGSAGAWTNYAFQVIVFASILAGRGLGRFSSARGSRIGLALVALVVLFLVVDLGRNCSRRLMEHYRDEAAWVALRADPNIRPFSREETYVALDPGYNRLYGRPDLTHDEWAYSLVEHLGAAPSRSGWLREAVDGGPVRRIVVVGRGEAEGIPGVPTPLDRMGYRRVAQHGRFYVWDRR